MLCMNTTTGKRNIKLLILDRDGVINENSTDPKSDYYYILDLRHFVFKEGVLEAFRLMVDLPYEVCVCTKQRCVGKGLLSVKTLYEIHEYMNEVITVNGGRCIEKFFIEDDRETKTVALGGALTILRCGADEALLLDDSVDQLKEAKEKLGLDGIHITTQNSLLQVIQNLLQEYECSV